MTETAELQIADGQWKMLAYCFREWEAGYIRSKWPANNFIANKRALEIIRCMYGGDGLRKTCDKLGISRVTASNVRNRLMLFLHESPGFPEPRCQCGKTAWHGAWCKRWNSESTPGLIKGHETQARNARLRHSDIFFQTIEQTKSMNTTLQRITIEDEISQFSELVQRGIDAWTEAGKVLIGMIEKDPEAKDKIIAQCPDLTEEILARFEAIGRKQLHPKTLLNNSPGMRRLRSLPFSDQEKYLANPIPVLIRTQSGTDVLNVKVQNLTNDQVLQVFCRSCVRSQEAQRAYIEGKRPAYKVVTQTEPYQIKGNKVVFNSGCEMSARDLITILSKIQ